VMQRFKLMKKSAEPGISTDSVGAALQARPAEQSSASAVQQSKVSRASLAGTGVDARPHTDSGSAEPDVLVMTATPIPRTLALTLYGDLDISVLDEMPPGRTPIVTRRVGDERADEVWQFVRKQVTAGYQAYVVYPVIEENEESELKAAMKMYGELSKKVFPDLSVAVLHGRMDADLKE